MSNRNLTAGRAVPREEESPVNDYSTSGNDSPTRVMPQSRTASVSPPRLRGRDGPHWRVDLKWVFAIPFTLFLVLTLFSALMFAASGRSKAQNTYADMLQPGLADPDFRADLALVSPEMLAFLETPEFSGLVYDDPAIFQDSVMALPDDPEGGAGSTKELLVVMSRLVAVIAGPAHSSYSGMLLAFSLVSLFLGVLVVVFSRRLGRLVSPAVCLALASLPLFILVLLLRSGVDRLVASNQEKAGGKLAADSLKPFTDNILGQAVTLPGFVVFLALVMLSGAGVWKLLLKARE